MATHVAAGHSTATSLGPHVFPYQNEHVSWQQLVLTPAAFEQFQSSPSEMIMTYSMIPWSESQNEQLSPICWSSVSKNRPSTHCASCQTNLHISPRFQVCKTPKGLQGAYCSVSHYRRDFRDSQPSDVKQNLGLLNFGWSCLDPLIGW